MYAHTQTHATCICTYMHAHVGRSRQDRQHPVQYELRPPRLAAGAHHSLLVI